MAVNLKLLTAQVVAMFVIFALVLFLTAGTIAWLAGWAFLVLFFGFTIAITLWLLQHNPGLLTERMTGFSKPNRKRWDTIFFALVNILFLAWLILMPLDAVRFHWSQVPGWLQIASAILMLFSFYLFFVTFRENSYLSPVVRIQEERGQTVVTTGPYHYVRHPMYAAALIFLLCTSLLLGSWYGIVLGLLLIGGIAFRAVQEERTLQAELAGYDEYMKQVRYRIIPYVW
ncbi:methyltransferase family protein [Ktedonospora formicarum]|uniref:Isoprenylcysteine carboxyl methyltransferase n=1 Tax=Ktedonospora formicarum TaxID=2778364 RepID=A0A8J3MUM2_9CHLR|nr:isoprenylcysteine carboxylmethyltransferase family protein [Ktedonospora formicarum]GHO49512.1 isoprenylcysteine carboxyl methyltransferase [Ktedonospora formicarum]